MQLHRVEKSFIHCSIFFTLFVGIPALISFLKKMPIYKSIGVLNAFDELTLLLTIGYGFYGFKHLIKDNVGRFIIIAFLTYMSSGIISGILNNVAAKTLAFQSFLELKFLLVIIAIIGLDKPEKFFIFFEKFGKIILVLCVPLVLWQKAAPGSYDVIFSNGGHTGGFHSSGGEILSRGAGMFWFPGDLADFSSFFCMYFLFDYLDQKDRNNIKWIGISVWLLLSTLSRMEITATILAILVVTIHCSNLQNKIKMLFLVIAGGVIVFPIIEPLIYSSIEKLGIEDVDSSKVPRVVFHYLSFKIAAEYYPFGSGFGTFGGHVANITDSYLYFLHDFEKYYWYRERIYMTDAYWAHVIGETGAIGATSIFALIFSVLIMLLCKLNKLIKSRSYIVFNKLSLAYSLYFFMNCFFATTMTSMGALVMLSIAIKFGFHEHIVNNKNTNSLE